MGTPTDKVNPPMIYAALYFIVSQTKWLMFPWRTAEEYFPQTFKPSAAFLFFGPILQFRVKRQQQEIMETVSLIHQLVVLRDLYWGCHTVTSKNGERVSQEHTEM